MSVIKGMGKVLATELKNVKIEFVSLVESGANGERFEVFKSADFKPISKSSASDKNIPVVDLLSLVDKAKAFLNDLIGETPKDEDKNKNKKKGFTVDETKEILEAIKGINSKVDGLANEVKEIKEKKVETDEEKTTREKAEATEAARVKAEKEKDEGKTDLGQILTAIKGIEDKVSTLEKDVTSVKEMRQPSNSIANDIIGKDSTEKGSEEEVDESADFFGNMMLKGADAKELQKVVDQIKESSELEAEKV